MQARVEPDHHVFGNHMDPAYLDPGFTIVIMAADADVTILAGIIQNHADHLARIIIYFKY